MTLLNLLGISDAYAATGASVQPGSGFVSMLPMLVILVAFMYFLIIRPQQKRTKEHKSLVGGLKKGDEVITAGGLFGKVVKVADNFVLVDIAENVEIKIQKSSVAASVPKGTIKSL